MSNTSTAYDHVNHNETSAQELTKLWFYLVNNEQKGPCLIDAMTVLYRNGEVNDATLIWSEGMAQWMPLSGTINVAAASSSPVVLTTIHGTPIAPVTQVSTSPVSAISAVQTNEFQPSTSNTEESLFSFEGRISRSEFWSLNFALVIVLVISFIILMVISKALAGVAAVIVIIPLLWLSFALAVRRLHDIGFSGWWLLISFVPYLGAILLFIFYCLPGTDGNNNYGSKPSK